MLQIEPRSLIGAWRRFGLSGPVYEIIAEGKKLPAGDETLRIRVIETGEELVLQARRYSRRSQGTLMFAIAFDLVVADTGRISPRS